jgi:hypothetical protein
MKPFVETRFAAVLMDQLYVGHGGPTSAGGDP